MEGIMSEVMDLIDTARKKNNKASAAASRATATRPAIAAAPRSTSARAAASGRAGARRRST
jgi:hypothetical protein